MPVSLVSLALGAQGAGPITSPQAAAAGPSQCRTASHRVVMWKFQLPVHRLWITLLELIQIAVNMDGRTLAD